MTEARSLGESKDCPWDDLVVSILAVNQYSLERTYRLLEGLQAQKVTDPASLARWETQEIERNLKAAGCDRGEFMTKLFAKRLAALGGLVQVIGVDECEKVLGGRDVGAIEKLLGTVNGIGPVVLRNFYLLRQIRAPK